MNAPRGAAALLAGVLVLALTGLRAEAIVVSGSFSGLASGASAGGDFSNRPFAGIFSIDLDALPDPAYTDIGPDHAEWWMPEGSTSLRFRHGSTPGAFYPSEEPHRFAVHNFADRQEVRITSGVWFGGTLLLVSTPGGLIDGLDFRSFRRGAVDLAASTFSFGGHQESGAGPLSALRFDTPNAPVPEPSTWALLLGGLAVLGGERLRARRRSAG